MKIRILIKVYSVLSLVVVQACVEPIELETRNFESALVVEATITDELKKQEIFLKRTYPLEGDEPSAETNADVKVLSEQGEEYFFEEIAAGKYISLDEFRASPGQAYHLEVTTSKGEVYRSEPERLPENSRIDRLYAERTTFRGEDGVALLLDISSSGQTSGYYKYEYVETYKIISPFTYPLDLVFQNGRFVEVPKTKEERICYGTRISQDIILANTNAETGNELEHFLVRFIDSDNFILSHRYSILVRQYVINEEAFSFYETLKDFSGAGNLFSQNQPGFINGNIFSVQNPEEKVIGIFNVAAVNSERIFFSFEDFFGPSEPRPLGVDCNISRPPISPPPLNEALGELLSRGDVKYLGETIVPGGPDTGPYRVVEAACVDCTVRGSNQVPEFWEE